MCAGSGGPIAHQRANGGLLSRGLQLALGTEAAVRGSALLCPHMEGAEPSLLGWAGETQWVGAVSARVDSAKRASTCPLSQPATAPLGIAPLLGLGKRAGGCERSRAQVQSWATADSRGRGRAGSFPASSSNLCLSLACPSLASAAGTAITPMGRSWSFGSHASPRVPPAPKLPLHAQLA